jgi:hypothetical protein
MGYVWICYGKPGMLSSALPASASGDFVFQAPGMLCQHSMHTSCADPGTVSVPLQAKVWAGTSTAAGCAVEFRWAGSCIRDCCSIHV